jgi:hypothetical protein
MEYNYNKLTTDYINTEDLDRINANLTEIYNYILDNLDIAIGVSIGATLSNTDYLTVTYMNAILNNIELLATMITKPSEWTNVSNFNISTFLTNTLYNAIEYNIYLLYFNLVCIVLGSRRCGSFKCNNGSFLI